MKFKISLFFYILGFSFYSFAKINDVFLLHGRIKSFDEKIVIVGVNGSSSLKVPRPAIVPGFKLQSDSAQVTIPIYAKYFAKIKTQVETRSELQKAIANPTNTVTEVERLIAVEQKRQKTLKR